jgi:hypothetical protein
LGIPLNTERVIETYIYAMQTLLYELWLAIMWEGMTKWLLIILALQLFFLSPKYVQFGKP